MDKRVAKVNTLLSIVQASIYSHLISIASNRQESRSYLGYIPPIQINDTITEEDHQDSKIESIRNQDTSIHEISEEEPQIPLVSIRIQKHGKTRKKAKTIKNDLAGFLTKTEGKIKILTEKEDLQFEFEETGKIEIKNKYVKTPKVLQRILSAENVPKPARFILPDDSKEESAAPSLYGEVIATTYSQGGDGFALHPGDFVSVLQFLHDFGLVECK